MNAFTYDLSQTLIKVDQLKHAIVIFLKHKITLFTIFTIWIQNVQTWYFNAASDRGFFDVMAVSKTDKVSVFDLFLFNWNKTKLLK